MRTILIPSKGINSQSLSEPWGFSFQYCGLEAQASSEGILSGHRHHLWDAVGKQDERNRHIYNAQNHFPAARCNLASFPLAMTSPLVLFFFCLPPLPPSFFLCVLGTIMHTSHGACVGASSLLYHVTPRYRIQVFWPGKEHLCHLTHPASPVLLFLRLT